MTGKNSLPALGCLALLFVLVLAGCEPTTNPTPQAVGPGTLNVADAAIAGGDADLALSITQSVLAADPGNADALVHEGDAYYALGRCPAATAAYQLALHGDAQSGAAETGLGRCLLKTDPAGAVIAFQQAVRLDPGDAAAYNDLGIAYDLEDRFAAAADAYRHALIANPEMTATEVNLGLSLALAGNGPAALQFLGPLANGQGATPKIREDYAAALVADDQQDEARTVLAIDLPPGKVNAALAGFNAVIAGDQPPLADATAGAAAPPTAAAAPLAPVATTTTLAPPAALTPPAFTPAAPPPPPHPLSMAQPPRTLPFGNVAVQLAALNSVSAAQQDWDQLTSAHPRLFAGRQPDIRTTAVNGRVFYRLRTGNFTTETTANRFCEKLTDAGCDCLIANF